jgi:hypothetical protein
MPRVRIAYYVEAPSVKLSVEGADFGSGASSLIVYHRWL